MQVLAEGYPEPTTASLGWCARWYFPKLKCTSRTARISFSKEMCCSEETRLRAVLWSELGRSCKLYLTAPCRGFLSSCICAGPAAHRTNPTQLCLCWSSLTEGRGRLMRRSRGGVLCWYGRRSCMRSMCSLEDPLILFRLSLSSLWVVYSNDAYKPSALLWSVFTICQICYKLFWES